jgi:hypothetical protein
VSATLPATHRVYGLVAAELDALLQVPTPRPGPPLLSGQWRDTAVEEVATA